MDLTIADLDEDGAADLVVANHEPDYVTLFFGIAGGGFERREHSRFRGSVLPHPHARTNQPQMTLGIPRRRAIDPAEPICGNARSSSRGRPRRTRRRG